MRHKNLLRVAIIGMAMASLFTACPEPEDIKNLKTPPKEEAVEAEEKDAEAGGEKDAEAGGAKDTEAGGDKDAEAEKEDPEKAVEEEREAPDTTAPTITGALTIKSNPKSSKTYKIGEVIQVAVTFSEKVNVDTNGNNGNIYLEVRVGKLVQARYESGSSSNTLIFAYTVKSGDKSSTGINIKKDALTITPDSGASIKDAVGNDADLKHKSMNLQENHKVDAKAEAKEGGDDAGAGGDEDAEPTVTEVKIEKDETYTKVPAFKTFREIEVAVTFSEKVRVKPNYKEAKKNIYVKLLIGNKNVQARYKKGTGSETLIFAYKYTVKSGDTSPEGIRIPKNALTIKPKSGASIKDAAGNNAKLEHAALER